MGPECDAGNERPRRFIEALINGRAAIEPDSDDIIVTVQLYGDKPQKMRSGSF